MWNIWLERACRRQLHNTVQTCTKCTFWRQHLHYSVTCALCICQRHNTAAVTPDMSTARVNGSRTHWNWPMDPLKAFNGSKHGNQENFTEPRSFFSRNYNWKYIKMTLFTSKMWSASAVGANHQCIFWANYMLSNWSLSVLPLRRSKKNSCATRRQPPNKLLKCGSTPAWFGLIGNKHTS